MQRHTTLVLGAAAAAVILGLAGCDSGTDADVGSLGIRMLWPSVAQTSGQRPLMVSLEVQILDLDLTPLYRADNPAERLRFNNVPVGNYIVQATGRCELNGLMGKTEFPVVVVPEQHVEYPVTADSPVAGVNVTPNPVRLQAGQTKRVIATAWNDAGIPLLIDPISGLEWTIADGAPSLTVDQDGLITVAPLADNPIVGKLFACHREPRACTELLIFVTPTLISLDGE